MINNKVNTNAKKNESQDQVENRQRRGKARTSRRPDEKFLALLRTSTCHFASYTASCADIFSYMKCAKFLYLCSTIKYLRNMLYRVEYMSTGDFPLHHRPPRALRTASKFREEYTFITSALDWGSLVAVRPPNGFDATIIFPEAASGRGGITR